MAPAAHTARRLARPARRRSRTCASTAWQRKNGWRRAQKRARAGAAACGGGAPVVDCMSAAASIARSRSAMASSVAMATRRARRGAGRGGRGGRREASALWLCSAHARAAARRSGRQAAGQERTGEGGSRPMRRCVCVCACSKSARAGVKASTGPAPANALRAPSIFCAAPAGYLQCVPAPLRHTVPSSACAARRTAALNARDGVGQGGGRTAAAAPEGGAALGCAVLHRQSRLPPCAVLDARCYTPILQPPKGVHSDECGRAKGKKTYRQLVSIQ